MTIENRNQDGMGEGVVRLGSELYDKLRDHLESHYYGQFVAIHVDSGDYAVVKSTSKASKALLEQHPLDGRVFMRKIGDEPEYGLAARILAGEMTAETRK